TREFFPLYLQVLNHEAVRLERLIQDLLDLSRLETESLPERIESVSLKQQVFKLVDAFAVKVRTKQISLQIEIPDDMPLLRMAENHLGQLLTNLVGNAIAYTFDNSKVLISASVTDAVVEKRMAHIVIQDNGPGIPQEEQHKIFDRFYRGKQVQMNREVPGTGLGLAICKEIVERYGGQLQLESVVGEGTTFIVKLPVAN
ncbi:MAG: HAMP domain-containing sensor histidine kinase, partial [Chloroflexota bacterium]